MNGVEVLNYFPTEALESILFPASAARAHHHHHGGEGESKGVMLSPAGASSVGLMPVDIAETSKEYLFIIDLPGLSKSDIQVTVEEENVLVIKTNGKRKRDEREDEEKCKYLRLERRTLQKKTMARKFRLPGDADATKITAKSDNGVLTIAVEKLPPPPKPKTVQISVS